MVVKLLACPLCGKNTPANLYTKIKDENGVWWATWQGKCTPCAITIREEVRGK